MCGIAGLYYFDTNNSQKFKKHPELLKSLYHRGPDHQAFFELGKCTLYHARLSIIDVSSSSNQPYLDDNKKNGLIFNGEIYNYKELQKDAKGDVEVLFNLLNQESSSCLDKLNGFFSFAFYDSNEDSLLIARDRFGVKPLFYYHDNEKLAFASELKPLLMLCGKQELDNEQIYTYFRLNYCSGPNTIFKNIKRLMPGQLIQIKQNKINLTQWYNPAKKINTTNLYELLADSVRLRLNADVPLGSFLSGGVDSSIISALAITHKKDLHTFSIGFKNESYFDETNFAEQVANHIGSNHSTFKLSEQDFLDNLEPFFQSIDEPFADSSAFNFYMLSKFTKQKVKVALSGDGADELFKGYYKHRALYLRTDNRYKALTKLANPVLALSNASRNSTLGNLKRRFKKFKDIQSLTATEAYKYLASISTAAETEKLLGKNGSAYFDSLFKTNNSEIDFELLLDLKIVLADDMLVKADRFSMRHGIEIRNPFLDYRVVEFAMNLDKKEKINSKEQKIILKKEFAHLLPKDIFTRSKKGFELPLQKWLSNTLQNKIQDEWLSREKINDHKILNFGYISMLNQQLCSSNPGDSAAKLWAILIFEKWLEYYKEYIKN